MAKVRLKLPGRLRSSDALARGSALVNAAVRAEVDAGQLRREGASDESVLTDADERDVLHFQWESGIVELVRVGELETHFGMAVRSSGDELAIPRFRALKTPVRGESALALERVQHIAVEEAAPSAPPTRSVSDSLVGKAVDLVTEQVADWVLPPALRKIEEQFIAQPGLYFIDRDGSLKERCDQGGLKAAGPHLVLLHGTFSSTAGAFKHLFGTREWDELYSRHTANGGRVLALEQRTVTDGPARNALELLQGVGPGARLHLLSHSRGGLVGDLLCRTLWGEDEINLGFPGERYETVRGDLLKLRAERTARSVTIERFLRVAAPAAGTQLAGRRLDQFLNVSLTLLGKLIDAGSGWFDFVKSIAVQLVSARTRADACPGLEAMMPDSPFVRFLNVAEPSGDDLAVVSGDVSDARWFQLVKQVFADFYFQRRDNDFIVDTASMTRGAPRNSGLSYRHEGAKADHFSYFQDERIRKRAVSFLADGKSDGFEPLVRGTEIIPSRLLGASTVKHQERRPELPTVVLLPGIMGTRLKESDAPDVSGSLIWVHLLRIATGGMRKLELPSPRIYPDGLIDGFYEDLARYLERDFNVVMLGYDWRASVKPAAEQLKAKLDELLDITRREAESRGTPPRPIHLIAHSMGGLVSRGLITWHDATWKKLVERGGRLIMLGTPNFGSYAPAQVYTGQHGLLSKIALFDFHSNLAQLTEIIKGFPGLLEMLPKRELRDQSGQVQTVDYLTPKAWAAYPNFAPAEQLLADAREVRDKLDVIPAEAKKSMVYVAGQAKMTPTKLDLSARGAEFYADGRGDGTVPWNLGLIEGVPTYYVDAEHDKLAAHEQSFPGYLELLKQGKTTKLATAPVRLVRSSQGAGAETSPDSLVRLAPAAAVPLYFPSASDLLAGFLSDDSGEPQRGPTPLRVSVVNAHVQRARHPIVVGHYEGDPITSVEGVLDRVLDGQLNRDHELRIYPGPIGTMRWYPRAAKGEQGVLVVGLGQMGTLTRPRLTETLREALLRYAADRHRAEPGAPLALKLTSLLVGSWGKLTVEDSICALLGAMREANQRLSATLASYVAFTEVEFIEIYRDLATHAAHVLRRLQESDAGLHVVPHVETPGSFKRNRPAAHYGYYNRVSVTSSREATTSVGSGASGGAPTDRSDCPDSFRFDVETGLARSDNEKRCIQWEHIERLLAQAPNGDRGAADTLFQYLLPWELRNQARDAADLVLQLDAWTAQIPWELLSPEEGESDRLVRRGILRSLQVDDARPVRASFSGRALVIGEPAGPNPPKPPLPGARAEAEAVARLLNASGLLATALIGMGPDENFRALLEEKYDIIHIAAHGHFDATNPRHSGVVLSENRFLTACEFENLKATPAIVFLNCCHLGQIRLREPGHWSASVARELIRIGVGVVIVAGWAVSDRPAVTFATKIYEELLSGQTLMTAVRTARSATRDETNGVDVTWGAYQVYGDPGFRLPERARYSGPSSGPPHPNWVSPHELVEQVLDLEVSAGEEGERAGGRLEATLEALWEATPGDWRQRGDVLSAFGKIYGALRNFVKAIEKYEGAIQASDTETRAVEQLANYQAREALRIVVAAATAGDDASIGAARKSATDLFKASRALLKDLLGFGVSRERYALLGATLKRIAHAKVIDPALGLDDYGDARGYARAAAEAYSKGAVLGAPADYQWLQVHCLKLCLGDDVEPADLEEVFQVASTSRGDDWARITGTEARLFAEVARGVNAGQEPGATVERISREVDAELQGMTFERRDSSADQLIAMIRLSADVKSGLVQRWLLAIAKSRGIDIGATAQARP